MAQVTLNPSADTQISSGNTTTNYGNGTSLWLGERDDDTGDALRILIKFDVSSIPPGSTINSATLRLNMILDRSSNARTARVRYLKRNWVENQATWNVYSSGNNWTTAGAAHTTDDINGDDLATASYTATESIESFKEYTLNATGLAVLSQWVEGSLSNYGFRIAMDTESNDAYLHDSNQAVDNFPELVIDYSPPIGGYYFMSY